MLRVLTIPLPQATIEILSKAGLKINKTLLPLGSLHTLQNEDVISVAVRRFKFEYVDSSSGSGLAEAWLPESPAPLRTYNTDMMGQEQGSGSNSRRFGASSRRRNSTRLHLFPEHAASKEVKDAILALAGNDEDEAQVEVAATGPKKRDLAYMEQVDEDEEEGGKVGIEEKILKAANSPVKVSCAKLIYMIGMIGAELIVLGGELASEDPAWIFCYPSAGQEDLESA